MQLQTHGYPQKAVPAASYKVRLITTADIPAVLAAARALHAENGIMPFSERRALDMVNAAIRGNDAIIGVIGDSGCVEAVTCLLIGQFRYSDYIHLEEFFAYVRPEFRKSQRAKALIEYNKSCADRLQVPLITGILSQKQTERKRQLYTRQLGDPAGYYWLYNGKTGA